MGNKVVYDGAFLFSQSSARSLDIMTVDKQEKLAI